MMSHYPAVRATGLPLALIAQAIPKLTRHDLENLTERLIDLLDEADLNGVQPRCEDQPPEWVIDR